MKKLTSIILSAVLLLALPACGGKGGETAKDAPDLNQYYEDFMASLGADNTPAMMDVETDLALRKKGVESGHRLRLLLTGADQRHHRTLSLSFLSTGTLSPPM